MLVAGVECVEHCRPEDNTPTHLSIGGFEVTKPEVPNRMCVSECKNKKNNHFEQ